MEKPNVVAITGSQRDGSHTATAVDIALAQARRAGAETDHVDLASLDLPLFDPDRPDAGDAEMLRRRVRAADAVLLATPMYHGSVASPLKTALDYCGFDEFEETTVGLLAVAGGAFPTAALDHLRTVARALDAWVLPHQAAVPDSHAQFADGELTDSDLRERVERLGEDLVAYAGVASCAADVAVTAETPAEAGD
nr:NAD(P)H-dependent oxidoreductase [Haloplanus aerogenes]